MRYDISGILVNVDKIQKKYMVNGCAYLVLLLVRLDNQALGHLAVLLHVGAIPHRLL